VNEGMFSPGEFPCPTIQCITLRVIGSLFRTGPGEHAFAVSIAVLQTKRRSWSEAPKVSTAPRIVSARDGSESRWIPFSVQLQSCRSFHRAMQVLDKKSCERRPKPDAQAPP
jgi:hypothetical protein